MMPLKVGSQSRRIRHQLERIVNDTPKMIAIRMTPIVLNIKDQLVANSGGVRLVANAFHLNNHFVDWQ